jgi:integrase
LQVTNPALLYILSLGSKESRDSYRRRLNQIAAFSGNTIDDYPWTELDPVKVQLILARLEDQSIAFSTINTYLSALKGVAKQAWRNGDIDGDVLARIKDIPNRKGSRLQSGQMIESDQVQTLIETALKDPNPLKASRDAALIAIGFFVGLRRGELGAIKLSDIDGSMGQIKVIGKGNKERLALVPTHAMPIINNYLALRQQAAFDSKIKSDYLFGQINKSGKLIALNGLTGDAIRVILQGIAIKSGIDFNQPPTPHDMRRTAVTNWLQKGDPRVAQALAGHEHIQTTMGYARDDLTDKMRKVVE